MTSERLKNALVLSHQRAIVSEKLVRRDIRYFQLILFIVIKSKTEIQKDADTNDTNCKNKPMISHPREMVLRSYGSSSSACSNSSSCSNSTNTSWSCLKHSHKF